MIGDALRARRQSQHRTLREVSTAANVSLGYLSEIERGQKEASSELLFSICDALGANLSEVLREVSDTMALAEQVEGALVPVGDGAAAEPPAAEASLVDRQLPDAEVSVAVHRDGPLKTTLLATRPGRQAPKRDVVCVA
jgi:transcriptional regulator with XRE-family HTH domain